MWEYFDSPSPSYVAGFFRSYHQDSLKCRAVSNNDIDDRIKAVAHKLLQKEEELKFITAPGRIPPRAAVVAAMRKEIAALRKELAEPGSQEGLDLTPVVQSKKIESTVPPSVPPARGRRVKAASSARNALLMVEKKLQGQSHDIPLSDKAMQALEMIEQNMSTVSAASKNLNDVETLQVENAILRTKLEVILEKKRHLTQVCQALQKGYLSPQKNSKEEAHARIDTESEKTIVYTI